MLWWGMRLRSVAAWLLGAALVLAAAAPVAADEPTPDDLEAARVHYHAGEQHYLRGRYAQAIEEFQEALRLSGRAELLYNISQAYERMGDVRNARDYLARYLESDAVPPEERGVLEDKLKVFDERLAAEAAAATQPATQPSPNGRPRPYRLAKWIAIGAGAALVVTSVGFTIDSASMAGKLEDAQDETRPFDGELADIEARGERDEVIAWVTGVAGVAALGAGVALWVLDGRGTENPGNQSAFRPVVGPGLVAAEVSWRF